MDFQFSRGIQRPNAARLSLALSSVIHESLATESHIMRGGYQESPKMSSTLAVPVKTPYSVLSSGSFYSQDSWNGPIAEPFLLHQPQSSGLRYATSSLRVRSSRAFPKASPPPNIPLPGVSSSEILQPSSQPSASVSASSQPIPSSEPSSTFTNGTMDSSILSDDSVNLNSAERIEKKEKTKLMKMYKRATLSTKGFAKLFSSKGASTKVKAAKRASLVKSPVMTLSPDRRLDEYETMKDPFAMISSSPPPTTTTMTTTTTYAHKRNPSSPPNMNATLTIDAAKSRLLQRSPSVASPLGIPSSPALSRSTRNRNQMQTHPNPSLTSLVRGKSTPFPVNESTTSLSLPPPIPGSRSRGNSQSSFMTTDSTSTFVPKQPHSHPLSLRQRPSMSRSGSTSNLNLRTRQTQSSVLVPISLGPEPNMPIPQIPPSPPPPVRVESRNRSRSRSGSVRERGRDQGRDQGRELEQFPVSVPVLPTHSSELLPQQSQSQSQQSINVNANATSTTTNNSNNFSKLKFNATATTAAAASVAVIKKEEEEENVNRNVEQNNQSFLEVFTPHPSVTSFPSSEINSNVKGKGKEKEKTPAKYGMVNAVREVQVVTRVQPVASGSSTTGVGGSGSGSGSREGIVRRRSRTGSIRDMPNPPSTTSIPTSTPNLDSVPVHLSTNVPTNVLNAGAGAIGSRSRSGSVGVSRSRSGSVGGPATGSVAGMVIGTRSRAGSVAAIGSPSLALTSGMSSEMKTDKAREESLPESVTTTSTSMITTTTVTTTTTTVPILTSNPSPRKPSIPTINTQNLTLNLGANTRIRDAVLTPGGPRAQRGKVSSRSQIGGQDQGQAQEILPQRLPTQGRIRVINRLPKSPSLPSLHHHFNDLPPPPQTTRSHSHHEDRERVESRQRTGIQKLGAHMKSPSLPVFPILSSSSTPSLATTETVASGTNDETRASERGRDQSRRQPLPSSIAERLRSRSQARVRKSSISHSGGNGEDRVRLSSTSGSITSSVSASSSASVSILGSRSSSSSSISDFSSAHSHTATQRYNIQIQNQHPEEKRKQKKQKKPTLETIPASACHDYDHNHEFFGSLPTSTPLNSSSVLSIGSASTTGGSASLRSPPSPTVSKLLRMRSLKRLPRGQENGQEKGQTGDGAGGTGGGKSDVGSSNLKSPSMPDLRMAARLQSQSQSQTQAKAQTPRLPSHQHQGPSPPPSHSNTNLSLNSSSSSHFQSRSKPSISYPPFISSSSAASVIVYSNSNPSSIPITKSSVTSTPSSFNINSNHTNHTRTHTSKPSISHNFLNSFRSWRGSNHEADDGDWDFMDKPLRPHRSPSESDSHTQPFLYPNQSTKWNANAKSGERIVGMAI